MPSADDIAIAEGVIRDGQVPREKVIDCIWELEAKKRGGAGREMPLGVVLVTNGLIKDADVKRLLLQRASGEAAVGVGGGAPAPAAAEPSEEDLQLGKILIAGGMVTTAQVDECLAAQRRGGAPRRLGEILVEKGYATAPQIQRALEYHHKTIYACRKCGKRFNVVRAEPGRAYTCKACGGPLAPADASKISVASSLSLPVTRMPAGGAGADVPRPVPARAGGPAAVGTGAGPAAGSSATPAPARPMSLRERMAARKSGGGAAKAEIPAAPKADPVQVDQASGLYLKQKGLVRREVMFEADRMQRVFAAYNMPQPLLTVLQRLNAVPWQTLKQLEKVDFATLISSEEWKKQAVPGYVITGKIASGGFATLFTAKPLFGEGQLALKILRPTAATSANAVRQFEFEADLLSRLDHPAIVKVHEYGSVPPNLYYMAMEFVKGSAIDFLLAKKGPFRPVLALDVTKQIAAALRYMQHEGYIHRDVKPENILLDDRGRAKLCDFGFAQLIQDTARAGVGDTTVGTAAYMSPEQARGELDIKVGTDIYALGLTCYAMLTGKPPFQGENTGQIMEERFAGGVAAPDLAPLAGSPGMQALVGRMLHPERTQRPRNYEELVAALDKVTV